MKDLDLKSAALAFSRENNFYPASIVQKAMERGAELAVIAVTEDIRRVRSEMNENRAKIENGHPTHGWLNGSIQL